jgi:uncharacterized membrane protein YphA (DoxX/SURF4 family)
MSSYAAATDRKDDTVEMQNLLHAQTDLEEGNRAGRESARMITGSKKPKKGLLQRLVQPIEERWSLKMLTRVWGPRVEFVVRLMLVATFLDDSLRTATNFFGHIKQVSEQGWLSGLAATSQNLAIIIATVALGIGVVAQLVGSACLLASRHPDGSTRALIGWTIAQPMLYGQLSNVEFVTESISLLGGLLLLRSHLVFDQGRNDSGALTQLLGRLMLPVMYLYYAWIFIFYDFTPEETSSIAQYISSLSKSVVDTAVIVGIVIGTALLFFGLKSRIVSLLLALVNLCFVTYLHPFFTYISLQGGEWKYDEVNMSMPQVALPKDISSTMDLVYDPAEIYDLHRYYFFLGLSTSGALLLLTQFGPGEIAVQKNEVILPVVRAAD